MQRLNLLLVRQKRTLKSKSSQEGIIHIITLAAPSALSCGIPVLFQRQLYTYSKPFCQTLLQPPHSNEIWLIPEDTTYLDINHNDLLFSKHTLLVKMSLFLHHTLLPLHGDPSSISLSNQILTIHGGLPGYLHHKGFHGPSQLNSTSSSEPPQHTTILLRSLTLLSLYCTSCMKVLYF